MEDFIEEQMEKEGIPGLGVGVISEGKLIYSKGFGYADLEEEIEVTPDTPFIIASISKTFTATAVMMLFEEDEIDLDDDINEYLPFEVRNPNFPDEPITFKMLLTHTSSIIDDDYNEIEDSILYIRDQDPDMSLEDFIKSCFAEGGEYYSEGNFSKNSPGEGFSYSNLATALLGYIVEYITETDFEDYCREMIFDPLGMNNTSWRLDYYEDSSIIALPYYDSENTKGHYTCPDYPNGLARSSVNDLSKFLLMFMNGGEYNGKRILSENTVELMKKQHFEYEEDGEKGRIGLIWYYEDINEDESYLGHEGGEEGVFTRMFYNVEDEVGVILLANLSEANVSPIEDRIYQEYS